MSEVLQFDNLGVYGRDDDAESVKGIDVGFPNGITFTILRAGGANQKYHRAVRKYLTPTVLRKVNKKQLSEDEDNALWRNIFVDSVIIAVTGAMVGGKEMKYTRENVVALLTAAPDMFSELRDVADKLTSFRESDVKEVAEHMGKRSSGSGNGANTKKDSKG